MEIFDILKNEDVYSVMSVMLFASSGDPNYALLNELAYLTDSKSFVNILKYFEGQTIRIPTVEESKKALQMLLLYHYYRVEKYTFKRSMDLAGYSRENEEALKERFVRFEKHLAENNYKTGGVLNVIKELNK